ncbi:MAG: prepilin-type N-terminal cleavage/methylation domain-containing protein [Planctomycetota bacterium]|nr:prepilin-type N-terminal cleavage/methylation domain-containing protein [Planctomycetota bacterium]
MKKNGFTLLEITVVVAIIALLSTIFLANYRGGDKQYALLRASHKLSQDLRTVEEMALSSRKTPMEKFGGTFPRGGYGIYVKISDLSANDCPSYSQGYCIILFADCDGEGDYDYWGAGQHDCVSAESGTGNSVDNEIIKEFTFEGGVKITGLPDPSQPLTITFLPPEPSLVIKNGGEALESAFITLGYEGSPGVKKVNINRLGQIEITSY